MYEQIRGDIECCYHILLNVARSFVFSPYTNKSTLQGWLMRVMIFNEEIQDVVGWTVTNTHSYGTHLKCKVKTLKMTLACPVRQWLRVSIAPRS